MSLNIGRISGIHKIEVVGKANVTRDLFPFAVFQLDRVMYHQFQLSPEI